MSDTHQDLSDYSPEARLLCAQILERYRLSAEKAERTTREMIRLAPYPHHVSQLAYWRAVRQGILWIQKTLVPDNERFEHVKQAGQDRTRPQEQCGSPEADGRDCNRPGEGDRQRATPGHDSAGLEFGLPADPSEGGEQGQVNHPRR